MHQIFVTILTNVLWARSMRPVGEDLRPFLPKNMRQKNVIHLLYDDYHSMGRWRIGITLSLRLTVTMCYYHKLKCYKLIIIKWNISSTVFNINIWLLHKQYTPQTLWHQPLFQQNGCAARTRVLVAINHLSMTNRSGKTYPSDLRQHKIFNNRTLSGITTYCTPSGINPLWLIHHFSDLIISFIHSCSSTRFGTSFLSCKLQHFSLYQHKTIDLVAVFLGRSSLNLGSIKLACDWPL